MLVFDGCDQRGEVFVADDAAELPLGFEHAGGGPPECHVAGLPALHVSLDVADDLDHRFAGVCRLEGAAKLGVQPEGGDGERLIEALSERACRVGVGALQLDRELTQALFGAGVVGLSPGGSES